MASLQKIRENIKSLSALQAGGIKTFNSVPDGLAQSTSAGPGGGRGNNIVTEEQPIEGSGDVASVNSSPSINKLVSK